MAKDAPTQSEEVPGESPAEPDFSPEAEATRQAAGPFEILKMPDDDNPGLPPEVWEHPPAGFELPK